MSSRTEKRSTSRIEPATVDNRMNQLSLCQGEGCLGNRSGEKLSGGALRLHLSPSDEIVLSLVTKIRVITVAQAARTWWGNSLSARATAKRQLDSLVTRGDLLKYILRAHPEQPLPKPVWSWNPGEPEPPYGVLSYRLRKRWTEPLVPTIVYVASTRSARLYAGSGGRLAHPLQVTHDLHVSALYVRLLRTEPDKAAQWVSEDVLAPLLRGKKIPDAELRDEWGETIKVIESLDLTSEQRKQIYEGNARRLLKI